MVVTNLSQFERELEDFNAEVEAQGVKLMQAVTTAVLEGVVELTPVVTGYTLGNWQVSVGAPVEGVIDAPDPSGASTIARGVGRLAGLQLGESTFVVNNAPHITDLEYGSDTSAPRPMVAPTLEDVEARFENVEEVP